MCLGVPALIISIDGASASVKVGEAVTTADLSLMEGVGVGDYVIVHAGFAIEKIDEAAARATLEELGKFLKGGDIG